MHFNRIAASGIAPSREEESGTFFFDILSDFSELRELKVTYCGIESFTEIENRILLYGTAIPKNNLRVLDLRVISPVASKIEENDRKDTSALLKILYTFTEISVFLRICIIST